MEDERPGTPAELSDEVLAEVSGGASDSVTVGEQAAAAERKGKPGRGVLN